MLARCAGGGDGARVTVDEPVAELDCRSLSPFASANARRRDLLMEASVVCSPRPMATYRQSRKRAGPRLRIFPSRGILLPRCVKTRVFV